MFEFTLSRGGKRTEKLYFSEGGDEISGRRFCVKLLLIKTKCGAKIYIIVKVKKKLHLNISTVESKSLRALEKRLLFDIHY